MKPDVKKKVRNDTQLKEKKAFVDFMLAVNKTAFYLRSLRKHLSASIELMSVSGGLSDEKFIELLESNGAAILLAKESLKKLNNLDSFKMLPFRLSNLFDSIAEFLDDLENSTGSHSSFSATSRLIKALENDPIHLMIVYTEDGLDTDYKFLDPFEHIDDDDVSEDVAEDEEF